MTYKIPVVVAIAVYTLSSVQFGRLGFLHTVFVLEFQCLTSVFQIFTTKCYVLATYWVDRKKGDNGLLLLLCVLRR